MRVFVELEFDEKELGPKWMNRDNLALLLYDSYETRREFLKIVSYKDEEDIKEEEIDK